jgi:beta-lactamase class A
MLATSLLASLVAAAQVGAASSWWRPSGATRPTLSPTATVAPTSTPQTTIARTASPSEQLETAGLDALSPQLATYMAQQGNAMGVEVYDLTRNRTYVYNATTTFTLASSAKVYILCAYLDMLERQRHAPSAFERSEMDKMIEDSDNNAAQWLYNRVGQQAGQARYLASIGVTDYVGRGYDWGWASLSPADMVRILTLLQTGHILSAADRAYALSLMSHLDIGRWGVGDTAPRGAQVYMKDGWVTGPDGKWAQNSSGIVVAGGETYIISVYIAHQSRYDWGKIQHVCGAVASLLTTAQ